MVWFQSKNFHLLLELSVFSFILVHTQVRCLKNEYTINKYHFIWMYSFNCKIVFLICKNKITVKIHLPTTVTQWCIPPRKYFNWINVGYGDMSINVSYPYYSFNDLYKSFHRVFPVSITLFDATFWANLILKFSFSKGLISFWPLNSSLFTKSVENKIPGKQIP